MNRITIAILVSGMLLTGCGENIVVTVQNEENMKIRLNSVVCSTDLSTRSPFLGNPSVDNPLRARVFSALSPEGYSALYSNGTITFSDSEAAEYEKGTTGLTVYPDDSSLLYFKGVYPFDNWSVKDGKASRAFRGTEDIMLSQKTSSSRTTAEYKVPILAFDHILTKLEIQVKAADEDALIRWSGISKIELVKVGTDDPCSEAVVDLNKGITAFQNPVPSFKCYAMEKKKDEKKYFQNEYVGNSYKPTLEPVFQAYTLASSVDASDKPGITEYTFRITAWDNEGLLWVMDAPVDLKDLEKKSFNGSTEGYSFVVVLSFASTRVNATATIQEWIEGGTSEVPVG